MIFGLSRSIVSRQLRQQLDRAHGFAANEARQLGCGPPVQFVGKAHRVISLIDIGVMRLCRARAAPDFLDDNTIVPFAFAVADTRFQYGGMDF